jgi:uncharacterized protein YjbI with pentapeptide repeats
MNWAFGGLPVLANASDFVSEKISSQAAYERLRQTGKLTGVIVEGTFDLVELKTSDNTVSPFKSYRINKVEFVDPVHLVGQELNFNIRIEHSRFSQDIHLQQCGVQIFSLKNSVLEGDLIVENCYFRGASRFDGNRFQGNVKMHFSRFLRRPSFRNTIFSGRAEFLSSEFAIDDLSTKAVSFSNVVFQDSAIFNNTRFATRAKFLSTIFESDAAFLNTRMEAGATFRNVHFKGDAEFRFCRIGPADFGGRDGLTLFAKRADFRGCEFESANFDYVEFRGKTSFVDARFGGGGASYRYANFDNSFVDFAGIKSDGPLFFDNIYAPTLHCYWKDIKQPLLKAMPDSNVLAAFLARFKASGDTDGALKVSNYLEHRKYLETVNTILPSIIDTPADFIDKLSQHLIAHLEFIVWGWPTGYGTKLGRIILISLFVWLIVTLPIITVKQLLARVVIDTVAGKQKSNAERKIYQPLTIETLAETPLFADSFSTSLSMSLSFMFRLLFKVGYKDIRYLILTEQSTHRIRWKRYFFAVWLFGSVLLLLISLTLANTSPLINKLLGELFP